MTVRALLHHFGEQPDTTPVQLTHPRRDVNGFLIVVSALAFSYNADWLRVCRKRKQRSFVRWYGGHVPRMKLSRHCFPTVLHFIGTKGWENNYCSMEQPRSQDLADSHNTPSVRPIISTSLREDAAISSIRACQSSLLTYARAAPRGGIGSAGRPIAITGSISQRCSVRISSNDFDPRRHTESRYPSKIPILSSRNERSNSTGARLSRARISETDAARWRLALA